jgi:lipid II:glycine glycyltransferase (peptidoglycan interpeptide bridge formation enzyme)
MVLERPSDSADTTAWDAFVADHPAGSLLQTSRWGKLKDDFGWDYEIVTVEEEEGLQGGALVLYKPLPMSLGSLAYVPRGPVVTWDDPDAVGAVLDAVEAQVRQRRAWACWIEPEAVDDPALADRLADLGYRRGEETIQPRSTILVDLTASEDDIMMRMKSKTRYNIRYAGRKGVEVRHGTVDDLPIFYNLLETTSERNEFGIHERAYYRRVMELFGPDESVAMLIAEVEDDPVAAILVFAVGDESWYIAGASSNRHRRKMPTYALQWEAMRWAKSQGCRVYDLWGIPDADEETLEAEFTERSDGLWGVYRFKRGFGGEVVRYVGMWERSLHPLYPLARKLYSM